MLGPHPVNEGERKVANAYDLSSAIPMRNLWSGYDQSHSLVCDPVQRCRTYRAQMELDCGRRTRRSSLLWGSPLRGLYQPMV